MRSLVIIAIGLAWLGVLLAISRWSGRPASFHFFVPLWFVAAALLLRTVARKSRSEHTT